MTMISRDPFARTEVHRRLRTKPNGSCDWCGSYRTHKGVKVWNLFEYYTETDGGREHIHKGAFCSKSCHDTYHS